jgi:hypothetical protein
MAVRLSKVIPVTSRGQMIDCRWAIMMKIGFIDPAGLMTDD